MLRNWYDDYKNKIDLSINDFLDEYFSGLQNQELSNFSDSVYYAIKGGKRIRSILALEFYSLFSKISVDTINKDDDIMKLCIAIELSHAYSLVHDDLPCMDNDEYRRGELTVWKEYGETHAVLVGDLLN